MKGHSRLLARPWMLAVGAVVFIAGHVIFFSHFRHTGVSLALVAGLALVLIAKHLGLLGSLYAWLRRHSRR